jgi:hypothetical protein
LNPENQQVEFSIEHRHYEWKSSTRIVDYDITVNKEWDTYMWLINKKDWRKGTNIKLKSNDLNDVFNQIADKLDDFGITENTRLKQNTKIDFAKEAYKKNVIDSDNPHQTEQIIIKYKSE